jgi:uncharacterized protein YciI
MGVMAGFLVLLTDDCEEYPGHDCVLAVVGPFPPGDEGRQRARRIAEAERAEGRRPHWVSGCDPAEFEA